MNFYTCPTCKCLNGAWRLHCQVCATIPPQYSIDGVKSYHIMPAFGCERTETYHATKSKLVTVELDYYAGA